MIVIGRRWRIAAMAIGVLLIGYGVFGFLGVPHLLRSAAKEFAATSWHRELALGDVTFNPFTLELELEIHDAAFPDALLGAGDLDPARVFLVRARDVKAVGGRVRAELALK
jgi:hypothetical protein